MKELIFKAGLFLSVLGFLLIFCGFVLPALIKNPDIPGAFAAGFVNPFAAGYSSDVIGCWSILLFWVIYESDKIKGGWIWVLLGIVPGVAVGFAGYLWTRHQQLKRLSANEKNFNYDKRL